MSRWKVLGDGEELRHFSEEAIKFEKAYENLTIVFEVVSLKLTGTYSVRNKSFNLSSLLAEGSDGIATFSGKARFIDNRAREKLRLACQFDLFAGIDSFDSEEIDLAINCCGASTDDLRLSLWGAGPTINLWIGTDKFISLIRSAQVLGPSLSIRFGSQFLNVYQSEVVSTLKMKKPTFAVIFPDEMPNWDELSNTRVDKMSFHADGINPFIQVTAAMNLSTTSSVSDVEKGYRETITRYAIFSSAVFLGCLVALKVWELMS